MRALPIVAVFAILTLSGCASGGGSSDSDTRRDMSRISAEELANLPSGTAYDAVRRLRPAWLRSRGALSMSTTGTGSLPRIFVDGRDFGSVESLRQFNVDSVGEMEYLSASDATTRYGTGYPGGIILLRTKRMP